MDPTAQKTCSLLYRTAVAVLFSALLAVGQAQTAPPSTESPAPAQTPGAAPDSPTHGVGFWDLPDRAVTVMLATPPRSDEDRYTRLRHYFSVFGCSGENLSDLPLRKNGHHPTLLCTLPGTTASRIVLSAWLPRSELFQGASDGWPDAVVLPMLYHALKAQPRRNTFVFAELDGDPRDSVDEDFQKQLEMGGSGPPLALVSVTSLGFGQPGFSSLAAVDLASRVHVNVDALPREAWRIAHLLGIDPTRQSVTGQFFAGPNPHILVRDGPRDLPRILIYSNPVLLPGHDPTFAAATFHQDLNFLAFYLADLDTKLIPPAP